MSQEMRKEQFLIEHPTPGSMMLGIVWSFIMVAFWIFVTYLFFRIAWPFLF